MLVTLTLLLLLQQRDLPTVEKNPFTTVSDIEFGKKNYNGRCAGCHGPAGDGGKGTNLAAPVLPRADSDLSLYRVIRYGIPETEMPGHNMTQREIWQIAAYVRSLGRSASIPGDPSRGEALVKQKGGCRACHIVDGEGGLSGPALTDIGAKRSPAYLRMKLLTPEKEIATGFSRVHAATRAGQKFDGVLLNQDTWSVQFRDNGGRLHSYWKDELTELKLDRSTPMPSYERRLSAQELDDIVAWLSAQRGAKR